MHHTSRYIGAGAGASDGGPRPGGETEPNQNHSFEEDEDAAFPSGAEGGEPASFFTQASQLFPAVDAVQVQPSSWSPGASRSLDASINEDTIQARSDRAVLFAIAASGVENITW